MFFPSEMIHICLKNCHELEDFNDFKREWKIDSALKKWLSTYARTNISHICFKNCHKLEGFKDFQKGWKNGEILGKRNE